MAQNVSRRDFFRLTGQTLIAAVTSACAPHSLPLSPNVNNAGEFNLHEQPQLPRTIPSRIEITEPITDSEQLNKVILREIERGERMVQFKTYPGLSLLYNPNDLEGNDPILTNYYFLEALVEAYTTLTKRDVFHTGEYQDPKSTKDYDRNAYGLSAMFFPDKYYAQMTGDRLPLLLPTALQSIRFVPNILMQCSLSETLESFQFVHTYPMGIFSTLTDQVQSLTWLMGSMDGLAPSTVDLISKEAIDALCYLYVDHTTQPYGAFANTYVNTMLANGVAEPPTLTF